MKSLFVFAVLILATVGRVAAQDDEYYAEVSLIGASTGSGLGGMGDLTVSRVASGTVILTAPDDSSGLTSGSGLIVGSSINLDSGLTMNFDLNQGTGTLSGEDNDFLSLPGILTVNLLALNDSYPVSPSGGTIYFAQGSDFNFAPGDGTLLLTAPAGYALDPTYGPGDPGYTDEPGSFVVNFVAVPEPSIWLLMAAGALGLFGFARQRLVRSAD